MGPVHFLLAQRNAQNALRELSALWITSRATIAQLVRHLMWERSSALTVTLAHMQAVQGPRFARHVQRMWTRIIPVSTHLRGAISAMHVSLATTMMILMLAHHA